ncbi:hypothetical protein UFOVP1302_61 [uncultured Caudovirales phage]|uniref:Uncharacterized protein n=1 Tax=uncultured Caudovirales phage TaxID=2100421 RepID=A0A6J5QJW9_9CAUD|nr:hypothetical protein UFOVP895_64 [uncultured Caudovirales phage]CAB4181255.1 hypothetical protein UFOVP1070_23 [uncultured Caudovirales phage]CAB4196199.1 hypothetical protein UFOVP1302_61 [uncultured Caudovirales phage]CAB4211851.1 hypothetical protein UFOVP1416_51 [uncultured Caudovirales phage]
MNVFEDQAKFMTACGQSVGKVNEDQLGLYLRLILGGNPRASCCR